MATRVATKRRKERQAGSPRKSPPKRPGAGGDRRSKAQVINFLGLVEDRLTSGHGRGAIRDELHRDHGIAESTVDRYIGQVHERWKADAEAAAPAVREQRIARITLLSEETRRKGKYAATAQFERMLNEIQGVGAPVFVPVPIGAGGVASLDLKSVADGFLEMLEAEVDKALQSRPPAGLIGDSTLVEQSSDG